jgi:hypothetical protein
MPGVQIKSEIEKTAPKPGFELSEQQMKLLKTVGEVALAATILGGVVALSAIAPNIFSALDKIFGKKQHGSRKNTLEKREEQLAKQFYYMRRQGYIQIEKRGELLVVTPTKRGRQRLAKLKFQTLYVKKPRKWKKTWWLVTADIPKELRVAANYFQKKLKQMDFYPFQRTVWVHPFDPREEIESVAAHYRVSPFVTVMEIKQFERSDNDVLENFFGKKGLI